MAELVLVNASGDSVLGSQFVEPFVIIVIAATNCVIVSHPFTCYYKLNPVSYASRLRFNLFVGLSRRNGLALASLLWFSCSAPHRL